MGNIDFIKEDAKLDKMRTLVTKDYGDLMIQLMSVGCKHDVLMKTSNDLKKILEEGTPCKYSKEELETMIEHYKTQAYEVIIPAEDEIILEAIKRKKADAEKFEAECMSLLSENYSTNKE